MPGRVSALIASAVVISGATVATLSAQPANNAGLRFAAELHPYHAPRPMSGCSTAQFKVGQPTESGGFGSYNQELLFVSSAITNRGPECRRDRRMVAVHEDPDDAEQPNLRLPCCQRHQGDCG